VGQHWRQEPLRQMLAIFQVSKEELASISIYEMFIWSRGTHYSQIQEVEQLADLVLLED